MHTPCPDRKRALGLCRVILWKKETKESEIAMEVNEPLRGSKFEVVTVWQIFFKTARISILLLLE